jgi:8-oxo-dGTP diphosphatase
LKQNASVVGIIFKEEQQQVLLIKRRDVPIWVLPGGGIEPSESPEEAICREMREETGFAVAIKRKVGEYTPINRLTRFTHFYECEILDGSPLTGTETKEIGFFPLRHLPKSFLIVHQEWMEDALKNEPYAIKKPISRVTYNGLIKYFFRHPFQIIRCVLSRLGLPINS